MAKKEYVLVRWVEEESVGVMPVSAIKESYFVGKICEVKFSGKLYDAEILKISGSQTYVVTLQCQWP